MNNAILKSIKSAKEVKKHLINQNFDYIIKEIQEVLEDIPIDVKGREEFEDSMGLYISFIISFFVSTEKYGASVRFDKVKNKQDLDHRTENLSFVANNFLTMIKIRENGKYDSTIKFLYEEIVDFLLTYPEEVIEYIMYNGSSPAFKFNDNKAKKKVYSLLWKYLYDAMPDIYKKYGHEIFKSKMEVF